MPPPVTVDGEPERDMKGLGLRTGENAVRSLLPSISGEDEPESEGEVEFEEG